MNVWECAFSAKYFFFLRILSPKGISLSACQVPLFKKKKIVFFFSPSFEGAFLY